MAKAIVLLLAALCALVWIFLAWKTDAASIQRWGPLAAAALRREIAEQRRCTPWTARPARGWRVWVAALALCGAIVLTLHLMYGG